MTVPEQAVEMLRAGLDQLLAAIHANDPKRELLVRVGDLMREAAALPLVGVERPGREDVARAAEVINLTAEEISFLENARTYKARNGFSIIEELVAIIDRLASVRLSRQKVAETIHSAYQAGGWYAAADAVLALSASPPAQEGEPREGALRNAAQQFVDLFVWQPNEETGVVEPHLDRAFPDFYDAVTKIRDAVSASPSPPNTPAPIVADHRQPEGK